MSTVANPTVFYSIIQHRKSMRDVIKYSRIKKSTILKVLLKRDNVSSDSLQDISKEDLVDICNKNEIIQVFELYRKALKKLAARNACHAKSNF
jgi:hypothetical protein